MEFAIGVLFGVVAAFVFRLVKEASARKKEAQAFFRKLIASSEWELIRSAPGSPAFEFHADQIAWAKRCVDYRNKHGW